MIEMTRNTLSFLSSTWKKKKKRISSLLDPGKKKKDIQHDALGTVDKVKGNVEEEIGVVGAAKYEFLSKFMSEMKGKDE